MFLKNLCVEKLIELSLKNEGSILTSAGALCSYTGVHTGRSPGAKKIVLDDITRDKVDWSNNNAISTSEFDEYYKQNKSRIDGIKNLFNSLKE